MVRVVDVLLEGCSQKQLWYIVLPSVGLSETFIVAAVVESSVVRFDQDMGHLACPKPLP